LVVFLFASMQAQRLFGRSEHVYLAVKASDAIKAAARLLTGTSTQLRGVSDITDIARA